MSPATRFSAKVAKVVQLTYDVRQIDLELLEPKEISFKAGQFISFDVTDPQTGRTVTRPYSIASSPSLSHSISLLLNLVPGGPGSTYLFGLREGDSTSFTGPAGNFFLRDDPTRDLFFVATGTGIAPIRSMLLANVERRATQKAILLWGVRSQRDLYYQDDFADLKKQQPDFEFMTTLSRPEAGWIGKTGRVTQLMESYAIDVRRLAVYLCGSNAMIKQITGIIQAKGLCPIFREKYYEDEDEKISE